MTLDGCDACGNCDYEYCGELICWRGRELSTMYSNALRDFINNYLFQDDRFRFNLGLISDVYFLVKKHYCNKDLTKVVACAELCKSGLNDKIYFIDWIDSVVRKHNYVYKLIQKIKKRFTNDEILIVPREIIEGSAKYWFKLLNDDLFCEFVDEVKIFEEKKKRLISLYEFEDLFENKLFISILSLCNDYCFDFQTYDLFKRENGNLDELVRVAKFSHVYKTLIKKKFNNIY